MLIFMIANSDAYEVQCRGVGVPEPPLENVGFRIYSSYKSPVVWQNK